MSLPPQGGWQHPQQPGPPPNQGRPHAQQFNPPGYPPPPPGWQQGNWPQSPGPPPQNRNSLKWLLIAVAVLLVIGISVGATLIFTRSGGGSHETKPRSEAPSDIASANDTGPVSIITEEPTCEKFIGINNSLADVQANGWGAQRGSLGTASQWTSDQRAQVAEVVKATQNAADQMVALARQTPNRVVRELYEQFIAYGRAYADSIPTYAPADDGLASANVNASSALVGICNAITFGSANRSLVVDPAPAPRGVVKPGDPSDPQRFISTTSQACTSFQQLSDKFNDDTSEWQRLDPNIPATQWTPEQSAIQQAALPFLTAWADDMLRVGQTSGNTVIEDFAATSSVYLRAFVSAGSNYTSADSWLSYVAVRINQLVLGACRAAVG